MENIGAWFLIDGYMSIGNGCMKIWDMGSMRRWVYEYMSIWLYRYMIYGCLHNILSG